MPYDRSEHVIGYGKKLAYADAIGGTYIDVVGTIDIQLPQRELAEAEVTNDSSPDFTKDFIPGMYDAGSATFKYRYGKTQYAALETLFALGTVASTRASVTKYWKVTLPDASTATFRGYLKKHDLPISGQDDSPEVECEIRVTSKVTFVPGT